MITVFADNSQQNIANFAPHFCSNGLVGWFSKAVVAAKRQASFNAKKLGCENQRKKQKFNNFKIGYTQAQRTLQQALLLKRHKVKQACSCSSPA